MQSYYFSYIHVIKFHFAVFAKWMITVRSTKQFLRLFDVCLKRTIFYPEVVLWWICTSIWFPGWCIIYKYSPLVTFTCIPTPRDVQLLRVCDCKLIYQLILNKFYKTIHSRTEMTRWCNDPALSIVKRVKWKNRSQFIGRDFYKSNKYRFST